MDLNLIKDLSVLVNSVGAGNCLLLSIVYLQRKENYLNKSGHILSLLFFIIGVTIINTIFNFTGYSKLFYGFEPLTNAFTFAIAPLLFLHVKSKHTISKLNSLWSIHLTPFYSLLILTVVAVWFPESAFGIMWQTLQRGEFIRILWNVQFLCYFIVIVVNFRKMKIDQSRNTRILIYGIASIWFINLVFYLYTILIKPLPIIVYLNITLLFSGMTLLLFYQKLMIPDIRSKVKTKKSKKLSTFNIENDSIIVAFQENKYYRDPNLDIRTLSDELQLPYYELSERINRDYSQNFNEFINRFRIQEVAFALETQQHQSYTIMGLAERAGFKSASTFYAAFKKEKGTTPTKYINSITKSL